jgi:hypothetical protein
MRRIVSKHQEGKKKRRNQITIGVILIFVMVISTLGFALQGFGGFGEEDDGSSVNNIEYNGFEFVNQNGLWVLGNFIFRNVPQQVEDIGFVSSTINDYQGKPLYIDSESEEAELEILINLGNIALRTQKACIEKRGCEENRPTKTCTDNFIIIRESNISNILQQDNCVFIEGASEDLTQLTDQFLFKVLGIR